MSKNWRVIVTLMALFAIVLTSCAQPAGPSTNQSTPIKFGVVQPLTGPVADSGNYVVSGVRIGVDKINAEGGVCGRPLEAIIQDGKNDPQESANAAELLITRDKVPVIMGAWGSSSSLAVMPVVEKHKVPLLIETSSSGKISLPETPGFSWSYRISPMSQMEVDASEGFLVEKLGMKKVAILSVNNDWGRGAAEVFKKAIEAHGGQVIKEDFIEQSATDVLPQLTTIKNSDADSILMTTSAGQIATILKQYRELGMTQTVLTTGGSNYPIAVMKLSSQEIVEGTYHLVFYVPDRFDLAGDASLAEWYLAEYEKRGLPDVGIGESYRGFDGVHVIAKAIEAADCKVEPQAIADAFSKVEFNGLSGMVKFAEAQGHQSRPNVYLVQMQGGKLFVPDFQFDK
jgi:branched-chain amino acid transport system substrate-binding protein